MALQLGPVPLGRWPLGSPELCGGGEILRFMRILPPVSVVVVVVQQLCC